MAYCLFDCKDLLAQKFIMWQMVKRQIRISSNAEAITMHKSFNWNLTFQWGVIIGWPVGGDNRMAGDFDKSVLKFSIAMNTKILEWDLTPLVYIKAKMKKEKIIHLTGWTLMFMWCMKPPSPSLPTSGLNWFRLLPFMARSGRDGGRGSSALIFHNQWFFYSNTFR